MSTTVEFVEQDEIDDIAYEQRLNRTENKSEVVDKRVQELNQSANEIRAEYRELERDEDFPSEVAQLKNRAEDIRGDARQIKLDLRVLIEN